MGYFYKAVVQAILLYGSETWILTEGLKRQFQSFHSRVARFLTGKHIWPLEDGSWHCPSTEDVLREAGLETVEEYILRRRQTVRGFVRHRPVYLHCMLSAAERVSARKIVWCVICDFGRITKMKDRQKCCNQKRGEDSPYTHTHTHDVTKGQVEGVFKFS